MSKEFQVRHEYMTHSGIRWRVTFAASILPGYDWAAYCSASMELAGDKNQFMDGCLDEGAAFFRCVTDGNKLSEEVARVIFPGVEEVYRR